jgi:hypothetical protein
MFNTLVVSLLNNVGQGVGSGGGAGGAAAPAGTQQDDAIQIVAHIALCFDNRQVNGPLLVFPTHRVKLINYIRTTP